MNENPFRVVYIPQLSISYYEKLYASNKKTKVLVPILSFQDSSFKERKIQKKKGTPF